MGISERHFKKCGVRVIVQREHRRSPERSGDKAVPQKKSASKKSKPTETCEPAKERQHKIKKHRQKAEIFVDLSSKFAGHDGKKILRKTVKSTVSKLDVLASIIGSEVAQLKSHRERLINKRLRNPEKYAATHKETREVKVKSRTDAILRSEYNIGPRAPISATIIHACQRSVGVQNSSLHSNKHIAPRKKRTSKSKHNTSRKNYSSSTCMPVETTGRSSKHKLSGFKVSREFTAVRTTERARQRAELLRYLESVPNKKRCSKRLTALQRYIEATSSSTSARAKPKRSKKRHPFKYASTSVTSTSSALSRDDEEETSSGEVTLRAKPQDLVLSDTTQFATTGLSSKYSIESHEITTKSELTEIFKQQRKKCKPRHHPQERDYYTKNSHGNARNSLASSTGDVAVTTRQIKQKLKESIAETSVSKYSSEGQSQHLEQTISKPAKEIDRASSNRRETPSVPHQLVAPQYKNQNLRKTDGSKKCYQTSTANESQRSETPKAKAREATVSVLGSSKDYSATTKGLKRDTRTSSPSQPYSEGESHKATTPKNIDQHIKISAGSEKIHKNLSDRTSHKTPVEKVEKAISKRSATLSIASTNNSPQLTNNKRSTKLSIPPSPLSITPSNFSESKSQTLGTASFVSETDLDSRPENLFVPKLNIKDTRSTATPDLTLENYSEESRPQKYVSAKTNHNKKTLATPSLSHERGNSNERKRVTGSAFVSENSVVPKDTKPFLKELVTPRIVEDITADSEQYFKRDSLESSQLESFKTDACTDSSYTRLKGGECHTSSIVCEEESREVRPEGDIRRELLKCSKGTQKDPSTPRGDGEGPDKQGSLQAEDLRCTLQNDGSGDSPVAKSKRPSNTQAIRCQVCQGIIMNNRYNGQPQVQQPPHMGGAQMQPCTQYNYSSKEVYCSCTCQNAGYPPQLQHCCRAYAVGPTCNPIICNPMPCNPMPCHPPHCYCRYTTGPVVGHNHSRTVSDLNTAEFYHRKDERGKSPTLKKQSALTPEQVKELRKLQAKRDSTKARELRKHQGATTDEELDSKDPALTPEQVKEVRRLKERSQRSKSRESRKRQGFTTDEELDSKDPALTPEQVKELRRRKARAQSSQSRESRRRQGVTTDEELDSKDPALTPEQVKEVRRRKALAQSSQSRESRQRQGVTTDEELDSKDPALTPEQVKEVRRRKGREQSSKSRESRQRPGVTTDEELGSKDPALTPEQVKEVERRKARAQSSKSRESRRRQGVTTDEELDSKDPALTPEQVKELRRRKARAQSSKSKESRRRQGVTTDEELDSKDPALTPEQVKEVRRRKAREQSSKSRESRRRPGVTTDEELDSKDPALTPEQVKEVRRRKAREQSSKSRESRRRPGVTTDEELDSKDPALTPEQVKEVRRRKAREQSSKSRESRRRPGVTTDEELGSKDPALTPEQVKEVERRKARAQSSKSRESRRRQGFTTDEELDSKDPALTPEQVKDVERRKARSQSSQSRESRQRQGVTTDEEFDSKDPALTPEQVREARRRKAQNEKARERRQRQGVTTDENLNSKDPALKPEEVQEIRKLKAQSESVKATELRRRQGVTTDEDLNSKDPALTPKEVEQVRKLKAQSIKAKELRQRQGVSTDEDLNSKDPALTPEEVRQVRKLKAQSDSAKATELRRRQGVSTDEDLNSKDPALTPEEVRQVRKLKAESESAKATELRRRQGVTTDEDLNSKDPALTPKEVEQVRKLKAESIKARELRQRQGVSTDEDLNSKDPALTPEEVRQVRKLKAQSDSAKATELRRRQGVSTDEDLNSKDPALTPEEVRQVRKLKAESESAKATELRRRQGVTTDEDLNSKDPALTPKEVEQVRKLKAQSVKTRELRQREGVSTDEDLNSKDPALTPEEVRQVRKLNAQSDSAKATELRRRQGVSTDEDLNSKDPALTPEEVRQVSKLKAESESAKATELRRRQGVTTDENLNSKDPALTPKEVEQVRKLKAQSVKAREFRQREGVSTDEDFNSKDPVLTSEEVQEVRKLKAQAQNAKASELRQRQGVTTEEGLNSKDPALTPKEVEQVRKMKAQSVKARELRERQGVTTDEDLNSKDPALTPEKVQQVRKLKAQSESAKATEFRRRQGVTTDEDLNSKDPALTPDEVQQVRKLKAQSVKAREFRQRQGVTTDEDPALTPEEVQQVRKLKAQSESAKATELRRRQGVTTDEDLNSKDPALTPEEVQQVRKLKAQSESVKATELRQRQGVTTDEDLNSKDPALTPEEVQQVRKLKAQSESAKATEFRRRQGVTTDEDLNSKDPALTPEEVQQVRKLKAQSFKAREFRQRQGVTTDEDLNSKDPALTPEEVQQVRKLKAQSESVKATELRQRQGVTTDEDLNSKDPALTPKEVQQVRKLKAQSENAKATQLRRRQGVTTDEDLNSKDPALTPEEVEQLRKLKAQSVKARELRQRQGVITDEYLNSKDPALTPEEVEQVRKLKAQSVKAREFWQRQGVITDEELNSKDPALTPEEVEQVRKLKAQSVKARELRQRQGVITDEELNSKDPALTPEEVEQVRKLKAQSVKARELRQRQGVITDEELNSTDPALTPEEVDQVRKLKAQSQSAQESEPLHAKRRGTHDSTTQYDVSFDAPAEVGRDFRGPPGVTLAHGDQSARTFRSGNCADIAAEPYRYDYRTVKGLTVTRSETGYIADICDDHEATETEMSCTDDVTSVLPCFTNISCTPSLPRQRFEYDLNRQFQNGARFQVRDHSPEPRQQRVGTTPQFLDQPQTANTKTNINLTDRTLPTRMPHLNSPLAQEQKGPLLHEDTTQVRTLANGQIRTEQQGNTGLNAGRPNQTIYAKIDPLVQERRQRADLIPGQSTRANNGQQSYHKEPTNRSQSSHTPFSDEETFYEQRRHPQINGAPHGQDRAYFPPPSTPSTPVQRRSRFPSPPTKTRPGTSYPGCYCCPCDKPSGLNYYYNDEARRSQTMPMQPPNRGPEPNVRTIKSTAGQRYPMQNQGLRQFRQRVPPSMPDNYETSGADESSRTMPMESPNRGPEPKFRTIKDTAGQRYPMQNQGLRQFGQQVPPSMPDNYETSGTDESSRNMPMQSTNRDPEPSVRKIKGTAGQRYPMQNQGFGQFGQQVPPSMPDNYETSGTDESSRAMPMQPPNRGPESNGRNIKGTAGQRYPMQNQGLRQFGQRVPSSMPDNYETSGTDESSRAMPMQPPNQGPEPNVRKINGTTGQRYPMQTQGFGQQVPPSIPGNYETSGTDDESFSRTDRQKNRSTPIYTENVCEEGTVYREGDEVRYNMKRETEHLYRDGRHRYAEERKEEIRGSVSPDTGDDYATSSSRRNIHFGPNRCYHGDFAPGNADMQQSSTNTDPLDDLNSSPQSRYQVPYEVEYTGCPCMQPTFDYMARTYHVGSKYDGDAPEGPARYDTGGNYATNN